MALDRFIHFEDQPKKLTVEPVVRAFFGEWPAEIRWQSDRFFVDIPGKPTNPMHNQERFIEIWVGEKTVNVITRQHDQLVNSIAIGLAQYIAGHLRGKLEED